MKWARLIFLCLIGLLSHTAPVVAELSPVGVASGINERPSGKSAGKVHVMFALDTEVGYDVSVYGNRLHDKLMNWYGTTYAGSVLKSLTDSVNRSDDRDSYNRPLKFTWFVAAMEPYCTSVEGDCGIVYSALVDGIPAWPELSGWSRQLATWGDEIQFHYHHMEWSDLDGNGRYWWNQLLSFDSSNDQMIRKMLNHLLLDKGFFPGSYRGGWVWEDNNLSTFLEEWFPFDFSNLSPMKRVWDGQDFRFDIYDWSQASLAHTFYHPGVDNYQRPGDMSRLVLRCRNGYSRSYIDSIFQAASLTDQCLCLYSHLGGHLVRQADSLQEYLQDASIVHGIPFSYVTAAEMTRAYLNSTDTIPPVLTAWITGDSLFVESSEPIYQRRPYVAVKSTDGSLANIDMQQIGDNMWAGLLSDVDSPCQVGIAVTDPSGNTSTLQITVPRPGDISHDCTVNLVDLVHLVSYMFEKGQQPAPYLAGDMDGDCIINVADITYLIDYLYGGGPEPAVCAVPTSKAQRNSEIGVQD
ncbi:MAG TPA: hypothetical protein VN285_03810 [Candidatus Deferrimicrobium sp.]|nr:hypothetical protein [Candidatus Deferrimicrobium sp.]